MTELLFILICLRINLQNDKKFKHWQKSFLTLHITASWWNQEFLRLITEFGTWILFPTKISNYQPGKAWFQVRKEKNYAATFQKHKESHQLILTNPDADGLDAPTLLTTPLSANTQTQPSAVSFWRMQFICVVLLKNKVIQSASHEA